MKYFLRLNSSIPEENRTPGTPLDWPVTRFAEGSEPDEDGLVECADEAAMTAYYAARQAAFDAGGEERAAYKAALALPGLKLQWNAAIDLKTREVIGRGFVHSGKTFSLSMEAQSTLSNTFISRDLLSYPVRWNTIDDTGVHELRDAGEVVEMYEEALGAVRAALDSGTGFKDLVRSASSLAELEAVVDDR